MDNLNNQTKATYLSLQYEIPVRSYYEEVIVVQGVLDDLLDDIKKTLDSKRRKRYTFIGGKIIVGNQTNTHNIIKVNICYERAYRKPSDTYFGFKLKGAIIIPQLKTLQRKQAKQEIWNDFKDKDPKKDSNIWMFPKKIPFNYYQCEHCNKKYRDNKNRSRHQDKCKLNDSNNNSNPFIANEIVNDEQDDQQQGPKMELEPYHKEFNFVLDEQLKGKFKLKKRKITFKSALQVQKMGEVEEEYIKGIIYPIQKKKKVAKQIQRRQNPIRPQIVYNIWTKFIGRYYEAIPKIVIEDQNMVKFILAEYRSCKKLQMYCKRTIGIFLRFDEIRYWGMQDRQFYEFELQNCQFGRDKWPKIDHLSLRQCLR